MKSYKFIISGKVQGVYYRVSIKKSAQAANYTGYVKNLEDGTVEAGVTCKESKLEGFINILKKGSQSSNVRDIKQYIHSENFTNIFEVR